MNFLAHIYLSGDDKEVMIGNFIADAVKGKDFDRFAPKVRQGILLHREIDHFTDTHPLVSECLSVLYPTQSKYAPVVLDIIFDHFLASQWEDYHATPLLEYVHHFYQCLEEHQRILPSKIVDFMPSMIDEDWLYHYHKISGMVRVFEGMAHRAKFPSNMLEAPIDLVNHYQTFRSYFDRFFPILIGHSQKTLKNLQASDS